ncbi:MAG: HAMP domain-containing sensor histidine kinase [Chloroflexota bacterium]
MVPSIRARLTLWLTVLIMLCTGALALYLYVAAAAILTGDVDRRVEAQARQVAVTYDFGAPDTTVAGAAHRAEIGTVDQFATASVFLEAFDLGGHVLARSSNLRGLHVPGEERAAALARLAPRLATAQVADGDLRVYSLPAIQAGRPVGLVLAAASLHDVTAATRTLLALLLGGSLMTGLLAAVGSGVLVRRGLRPVDQIAGLAESITARRLDQRLALRDPPREVERLLETFNGMLTRLHETFAAQRRFVADASHELRTPLATIRGRSEVLLLKTDLDDDTRDGLKMMRDEAGRMGRLVANLLLLARGDEEQAIDRRPVELDLLMLEVTRQGRSLAQDTAVTLSHADQAVVLGDPDLLKQLVLNLVENALAYTPPGGRVDLTLTVAGDWARLSVRDTGPGIAPEDLQRIFERFYRPDRARSRRSGGAGLGLAIVRWIAEAHGGEVVVESVVGKGSTFTLILPVISNQTLTKP